jgi:YD repeat-containing protein
VNKKRTATYMLFGLTSIALTPISQAQDYINLYKYDARGRLVSVTDSSSKEIKYAYDDAGNRIAAADETQSLTLEPTITSFTGPSSVLSGASVTLSWTSTSTSYCGLYSDSFSYPNLSASGSKSFNVYQNTAVTLTCYKNDVTVSQGKLIRTTSSGGGGPLN